MRLDRALAARGLARSRTHAQALIAADSVLVGGIVARRSSLEVNEGSEISLAPTADAYVSRGAHKLIGALDAFAARGLAVAGRAGLDAGASTGGFTQVLLERGAASVLAIDVGHGQMAESISGDPRVTSREGVNVRDLEPPAQGTGVDLIVADLSFISLSFAVTPLAAWLLPDGDMVLMVKPQFEVGAGRLGRGGVVRRPEDMADAVASVARSMASAGFGIADVSRSVMSGPRGTVEFFVWGRRTWQAGGGVQPLDEHSLEQVIEREVKGSA
jgi:23S rRNA (cytidine1920-2'-O)/16S rRNA (cytidine1409-2'-O)-methyltransferase